MRTFKEFVAEKNIFIIGEAYNDIFQEMTKVFADYVDEVVIPEKMNATKQEDVPDFTLTFQLDGKWHTITNDLVMYIDGKCILETDIPFGNVTYSASKATNEQIRLIHQKNKEYYHNINKEE